MLCSGEIPLCSVTPYFMHGRRAKFPGNSREAWHNWAGRPYFVHLEDNEEYILESLHHMPYASLVQEVKAGRIACNDAFSHPLYYREFLRGSRRRHLYHQGADTLRAIRCAFAGFLAFL